MSEIISIIGVVTLLFGTWKVTEIAKTMGRVETLLDILKKNVEDNEQRSDQHELRITKLEQRLDGRHPDPG